MKILTNLKLLVFTLVVQGVFISCNEDFPNILKEDYGTSPADKAANKVLVIVTDGVRGSAIGDLEPDNFRVIARNSLFSYNSMADYKAASYTKEIGLANILTGVTSNAHKVNGESLSTVDLNNNATLFTRLKAADPEFEGEAYTSSAALKNFLLKDVPKSEVLSDDDAVVAKTKQVLADSESGLILAHLSNPYHVGEANSYESTDAAYRSAILKVDQQVGDLVAAVKARKNFKTENWLIVITSSVGGEVESVDLSDKTLFADSKRNTFTYMYSPKFIRKYLAKPTTSDVPFSGNALVFKYGELKDKTASARLMDATKVNFNGTQSFSFNFFYKQNNANQDIWYSIVLSKRSNMHAGQGWQLLGNGEKLEFGANGLGPALFTSKVNDGKWHSITVTIDRAKNEGKIYTDGVATDTTTVGTSSWENSSPFILGYRPGEGYYYNEFTMANLQVYNKALSSDEVKDYAGLTFLTPDDTPLYDNLEGYWPGYDDIATRTLTDVTGKSGNMEVVNDATWTSFEDLVPSFYAPADDRLYASVPNLVDIPYFIYQWFGILPSQAWNLEGVAWTPPYAILEY